MPTSYLIPHGTPSRWAPCSPEQSRGNGIGTPDPLLARQKNRLSVSFTSLALNIYAMQIVLTEDWRLQY